MFKATHLGHLGWLIESGSSRVIVDPLLGDQLLPGPNPSLVLYPPRNIDHAAFPPIDAVIFSHEHLDHLNVPTLLRLDRSIRCLLPACSSTAARALLAELGFEVTLMHPGQVIEMGELEIHPFYSTEITRDEWDVMPLVIRDRNGHGSLATSIDAPETVEFARFAAERAGRIGIWVTGYNQMDLFPVIEGAKQSNPKGLIERLSKGICSGIDHKFRNTNRPESVVVLAGALSLAGSGEWLNRHVFPATADAVVGFIAATRPDLTVQAPLPGNGFTMQNGKITEEHSTRPFLSSAPRDSWPPYGAERFTGEVPDYEPLVSSDPLDADSLASLEEELGSFAEYLYSRPIMTAFYTSRTPPSIGFSARNGNETIAFRYHPQGCHFERLEGVDARADFIIGFECWASDLLAILRYQLPAGVVFLGRCLTWNRGDGKLSDIELEQELTMYTHPLRSPRRTLAQYRRVVADSPETPGPLVPGPESRPPSASAVPSRPGSGVPPTFPGPDDAL